MNSDSDDDGTPPELVRVARVGHRGGCETVDVEVPVMDHDVDGDNADNVTNRNMEVTAAGDFRDRKPVPVLLLTGFLGAGKSTLVQYILTARHGHRIAVVMNEIGDTADIEKAAMIAEPEMLDAAPVEDWVELENGCICCSAKNDLVKSMERLIQQRDRFDYIIIEGTGLMDPGAVAAALWTDEEMQAGSICLDAIVTVVDAKQILKHIDDTSEEVNHAQRQIAYADVLLMNKVDLVDEDTRQKVVARVREISDAKLIECERCVVDLGAILGTGLYRGVTDDADRDGDDGTSAAADNLGDLHDDDGGGDRHHYHHLHHHTSNIGTETFLLAGKLDIESLKDMLDTLLWEGGDTDIFRAKGLVHASDGSAMVLQAVGDVYELRRVGDWEAGKPTKIVFIGRGLERESIQAKLACCESC